MDAKERQLIQDLADRVRRRVFHEREVLALLILLRAHSPSGSSLRELADFVAHREKDRGALKSYVQHVVDYREAHQRGATAPLKIDAVHTPADFHSALKDALGRFAIAEVEREQSDDAFACIMTLLQGVGLHHKEMELGRLSLGRFDKQLWLCGSVQFEEATVLFPALMLENRYCAPTSEFKPFGGIVEARCVGGRLHLYIGGTRAA